MTILDHLLGRCLPPDDVAWLQGQAAEQVLKRDAEIAELRAALLDATEGMDDMVGYVPEYFREKWDHDAYIVRAKQVLSAHDNDRTWGPGQWVRCEGCPSNETGQPYAYHHRDFHCARTRATEAP